MSTVTLSPVRSWPLVFTGCGDADCRVCQGLASAAEYDGKRRRVAVVR